MTGDPEPVEPYRADGRAPTMNAQPHDRALLLGELRAAASAA
ncbi:hypothetical protein ACH4OY_28040 [Micromonospora rubida]|uniref:Uncharacterized protein n=1 Tax=Micromonospora rubida TaxID=2697657 RepID=A0ABW7SS42_9ACTN